jgi:hypothetical protein
MKIKKILLSSLILVFFSFCSSLIKSQARENEGVITTNNGLFISPEYTFSGIKNNKAEFWGLSSGFISNDFEIGIKFEKLNTKITHDIPDLFSRLKFDIFSCEIALSKYFSLYKKLLLSPGLSIGSAYTTLKYLSSIRETEYGIPCCFEELFASDSYIFFKPNIKISYSFVNNLSVNIGFGYRLITCLKMDYIQHPDIINFNNHDYSNMYLSLSLKYIIRI